VGLLGGSIGLSVRSRLNNCHVIGYGHRNDSLNRALATGAIHEATTDPSAAVNGADFVVLATPVGQFERVLGSISAHLKPGAVVTDVGSTKRSVVALAEKILPETVRFVGSHPIAGGERAGIDAARVDLFDGALCITTPAKATDPAALETVESFWRTLGMRITRLSPDDHDRLLADVSHLPHLLAAALVAMQSPEGLPLAGKGLADMTRIAAGDGGLWRDILLDNADNVRDSIDRIRRELERVEAMLRPEQRDALRDYLDAAAEQRRSLGGKS
jgi:prephenate dehydrogenase